MASRVYNSYKLNLLEATFAIRTASGVKMLLLKTLTTTPDNPDHDFANDISADEFSDSGYTGGFNGAGRKSLANRTTNADLANDRAELDFDDVTWTSLGGTQSVVMAVIVRESVNDAGSNLVSCHDVADTVTDGTDYTLQVGSEGAIHIT